MSRLNAREQAILDMRNVLDGLKEIHVWRGERGQWLLTKAVWLDKDGTVDPAEVLREAGITPEFAEATQMSYGGIAPLDEVERRLHELESYSEEL